MKGVFSQEKNQMEAWTRADTGLIVGLSKIFL